MTILEREACAGRCVPGADGTEAGCVVPEASAPPPTPAPRVAAHARSYPQVVVGTGWCWSVGHGGMAVVLQPAFTLETPTHTFFASVGGRISWARPADQGDDAISLFEVGGSLQLGWHVFRVHDERVALSILLGVTAGVRVVGISNFRYAGATWEHQRHEQAFLAPEVGIMFYRVFGFFGRYGQVGMLPHFEGAEPVTVGVGSVEARADVYEAMRLLME